MGRNPLSYFLRFNDRPEFTGSETQTAFDAAGGRDHVPGLGRPGYGVDRAYLPAEAATDTFLGNGIGQKLPADVRAAMLPGYMFLVFFAKILDGA